MESSIYQFRLKPIIISPLFPGINAGATKKNLQIVFKNQDDTSQKLLSEISGYDTLSFACPPWWGVTNLLHKSTMKMTCSITAELQKILSETLGYDTLSLGEGRGEATAWPSKFP